MQHHSVAVKISQRGMFNRGGQSWNCGGLRCLVKLADAGSIMRTAEKLHLSPAAIHKQLKVLEDEMGLRLYEKAGRQLRLTQAAEVLLPHIESLLAQYDAILSMLSEWKGLKRGFVRIGTGATMSSYLLLSLFERFRRLYPDVELFVETGNTQRLLDSLSKGSLDLTLNRSRQSTRKTSTLAPPSAKTPFLTRRITRRL